MTTTWPIPSYLQTEILRVLGYPQDISAASIQMGYPNYASELAIFQPFAILRNKLSYLASAPDEAVTIFGGLHPAFPGYYANATFTAALTTPSNPSGETTPITVNHSGTISQASVAQVLMPANPSRTLFEIQNTSSYDLYFDDSGATATINSFVLGPGLTYTTPSDGVSQTSISVFGTMAGQSFTATEITNNASTGSNGVPLGTTLTAYIGGILACTITSGSADTTLSMAQKLQAGLTGNNFVTASYNVATVTMMAVLPGDAGNGVPVQVVSNSPALLINAVQSAAGATWGGMTPPGPWLQDESMSYPIWGYLPIIRLLQADIGGVRQDLRFIRASVAYYRGSELPERDALCQRYRRELADRFAVPLDPDIAGNRRRLSQRVI